MNEKEKEMLEMFVDNDNSVPFETRVKKIIDRYFKGCGIKSDDSYIEVIRDACRKLAHVKNEDVSDRLKRIFENIPCIKLKRDIRLHIQCLCIVYGDLLKI